MFAETVRERLYHMITGWIMIGNMRYHDMIILAKYVNRVRCTHREIIAGNCDKSIHANIVQCKITMQEGCKYERSNILNVR